MSSSIWNVLALFVLALLACIATKYENIQAYRSNRALERQYEVTCRHISSMFGSASLVAIASNLIVYNPARLQSVVISCRLLIN